MSITTKLLYYFSTKYIRKLSRTTFGVRFLLWLSLLFSKTNFSVYDFVKFLFLLFLLLFSEDFIYPPTYNCPPPWKGVSAHFQNTLYASHKNAHAFPLAWHMHSFTGTLQTQSRSLYSLSNIFHKGHSCMNPIRNINRKSRVEREKKRRAAKIESRGK